MSIDSKRAAVLSLVMVVAGCAAVTTAIGGRDLTVETRSSDTIFLEPVRAADRTVFVEVKNTSDRGEFDLDAEVSEEIRSRGYRIVDDPDEARYLLQANVLEAGSTSETAAEQTLGGGFGSVVVGGAIGAVATRAASRDVGTIIAGGLVGAATSAVADSYVKDITYAVVADVQVSERANEGVVVTETLEQPLHQGTGGPSRVIRSTETHDWKRYQTRIVSIANQANLDFEDAAPGLANGLTRAIAGIF